MVLKTEKATLADAEAVAEMIRLVTPFSPRLDLQFSNCDPESLRQYTLGIATGELGACERLEGTGIAEGWVVCDYGGDGEGERKVVGMGIWGVEGAAEKMYSGGLKLPLPEGTHTALKNHFTTLHSAMADEHRPRGKFYELLELITSPAYQRRGIGASLIQYGLEKADKEGVPCYLTASPMGAPLYKKVGFEEVGRVEVELEQFGGEKGVKHVHLAMIRPARKLENGTSS